MLVFKSIRNNQTVTLTNHAEYFSSIVIVETGEELIQEDQTGELKYTFPQKGEHRVAVQFKEGITDLSKCFLGCHQLIYIPDELFNTCSEVKKLERCFAEIRIKEIPEGLFKFCTKIEDLSYCFCECRELKSIPKGLLDSCTKVKKLERCFFCTDI